MVKLGKILWLNCVKMASINPKNQLNQCFWWITILRAEKHSSNGLQWPILAGWGQNVLKRSKNIVWGDSFCSFESGGEMQKILSYEKKEIIGNL